jgi:DNA (cytosine-5)-methyltransferase 1
MTASAYYAYYNEIDPFAAQWLRNLINAKQIAPGVVDTRSIEDIRPDELTGFTQCHFFAGIGLWSLSLRRAGWPDNRPVWTGSCPCQPFSAAGQGNGFADERHLWPAWFHLITECRPVRIYGEQVASKDGLGWFDLVSSDLEGAGYACGAVDLCAAGFGAPHIRQRLGFVAGMGDTERGFSGRRSGETLGAQNSGWRVEEPGDYRFVHASAGAGSLADSNGEQRQQGLQSLPGRSSEWVGGDHQSGQRMGDINNQGPQEYGGLGHLHFWQPDGRDQGRFNVNPSLLGIQPTTRTTDTPWSNADWLWCRDEKWRPVEPGTFPLVNGYPARVGVLRAYGNAIVPEVFENLIRVTM